MTVQKNLIYDVGAHQGEDSEYYLKKGFKVVAIEANPTLCAGLKQKFAREIEAGQYVLVERAISSDGGSVDFFINDENSVWGTIDPNWAVRNAKLGSPSRKITVQAERFEDLLRAHGIPYYLKIDIEGADMLCIKALEKCESKPQYVSVESEKLHWPDLINEFNILDQLGYRKFNIVNQRLIPGQKSPTPALEGREASHAFAFGSTGLFGRELPGPWLSRAAAINRYRRIFLRYKLIGDNTLGRKIIRHIPFVRRILTPDWYDTHASL